MNVKEYTATEYRIVTCMVHGAINKYLFSKDEIEFFFARPNAYPICQSCAAKFRQRLFELTHKQLTLDLNKKKRKSRGR